MSKNISSRCIIMLHTTVYPDEICHMLMTIQICKKPSQIWIFQLKWGVHDSHYQWRVRNHFLTIIISNHVNEVLSFKKKKKKKERRTYSRSSQVGYVGDADTCWLMLVLRGVWQSGLILDRMGKIKSGAPKCWNIVPTKEPQSVYSEGWVQRAAALISSASRYIVP